MTQKEKLSRFDGLLAHAQKMECAMHDYVNGKFSIGTTVKPRDFDATWNGGFYAVQVSWRSMPLFLVRYKAVGQSDSVEVWTESEIENMYRDRPLNLYARCMMAAKAQLWEKYRKAAA